MPQINLLIKPASGSCNLRCEYCFYRDEMQNRSCANFGIMNVDTLETVVEKTLRYSDKTCGFAFQGGEPTLVGLPFFIKLIELQKQYNKKLHVHNSIQTNGININRDWADFFAKNKFLVGLSLDGIKDTHNCFRKDANGKDTFYKVMDTAELFDSKMVEYNILTVVNSITSKNIGRIYRFYQRRGFRYLQFIACLDNINEKPQKYSLTPEMYGKFLCDLFDFWYEDLMLGKQPYIRSFENYIGILCGLEPESCDMRGTCGIQYVIEADGSVYPCDFYTLDHMRIGNLLTDDFSEIDKRRIDIKFISRSEEPMNQCCSCQWLKLCRGGCMRHRMKINNEVANYYCTSFQQFFEHTGTRMYEIANAVLNRQRNYHRTQSLRN